MNGTTAVLQLVEWQRAGAPEFIRAWLITQMMKGENKGCIAIELSQFSVGGPRRAYRHLITPAEFALNNFDLLAYHVERAIKLINAATPKFQPALPE